MGLGGLFLLVCGCNAEPSSCLNPQPEPPGGCADNEPNPSNTPVSSGAGGSRSEGVSTSGSGGSLGTGTQGGPTNAAGTNSGKANQDASANSPGSADHEAEDDGPASDAGVDARPAEGGEAADLEDARTPDADADAGHAKDAARDAKPHDAHPVPRWDRD